jgi:hypothetical protein
MAKKRRRSGENMSAYFRTVFTDQPQWLDQKSNDDVVARYRADHGMGATADVGQSVKQTMANMKSIMRKEARGGSKVKARRGRPPKAVALATMPAPTGKPRLETLEELIDDCMVVAKGLDRDGLDHVIRLLRHARNGIVWKMGQKD